MIDIMLSLGLVSSAYSIQRDFAGLDSDTRGEDGLICNVSGSPKLIILSFLKKFLPIPDRLEPEGPPRLEQIAKVEIERK